MGKKRREPEEVDSVELNGVCYEAPLEGALYGYQQDGGIITARNLESGELEWTKRVYTIAFDEDMEDDKQDVYITEMQLVDDNSLEIRNEHGQQFTLDLETLNVEKH